MNEDAQHGSTQGTKATQALFSPATGHNRGRLGGLAALSAFQSL